MHLHPFISSGMLINGLKQGSCIESSNIFTIPLIIKNTYKNGYIHGDYIAYSSLDGVVISRTSYKYGYKHGRAEYYYANGYIAEANIYLFDVLRGREIYSGKMIREKQIYNINTATARKIDKLLYLA